MMGKRNVYSYLARQRKAGPHSKARRPDEHSELWSEDCPVCYGTGIDEDRHEDGCCELCEGLGYLEYDE